MKPLLSDPQYLQGMEHLIEVVQELSHARKLETIVDIVRHAARKLTGADGATFVMREGEQVHYVDEDAIGPLWKGHRFPMTACISGWAIMNREHAVIDDIYADRRVPQDAYRKTFVKSLAMMPVRKHQPIAAIGNYWATHHLATPTEIRLLQSLADSTSIALENLQLYSESQASLARAEAASVKLQAQLDLRDDFISIVAHELQTPITALDIQNQLFARMTKNREFAEHPREEMLVRFVDTSSRRLSDLKENIGALLDVSQIRFGNFQMHYTNGVDAAQILQAVIQESPLSSQQVALDLSGDLTLRCDPIRIRQVMTILLSNAHRFGEGKPVQISARRSGDQLELTIKDEGIGISPEDQQKIFERFERVNSVHNYGGFGLGLYIAQKIITAHGGTFALQSTLGAGATFTVQLPAEANALASAS